MGEHHKFKIHLVTSDAGYIRDCRCEIKKFNSVCEAWNGIIKTLQFDFNGKITLVEICYHNRFDIDAVIVVGEPGLDDDSKQIFEKNGIAIHIFDNQDYGEFWDQVLRKLYETSPDKIASSLTTC